MTRSGGCPTPIDVENELFGAATVTPWSSSNAQYRANVLAYLQGLAQRGAHPVLLAGRSAYLGSPEAVAWWLQVAQVADIVREEYIPATSVWKLGPVLGNRLLRARYRAGVAQFTAIGIPASRLGIMVSVLSQKGGGGRNGLEPASAWYQVVKWYALSAKEVAGELGLGSVFSWGWQQWNPHRGRSDEAGRRLRLALGAAGQPLQRSAKARPRLRYVTHRGADLASRQRLLCGAGLRDGRSGCRHAALSALPGTPTPR